MTKGPRPKSKRSKQKAKRLFPYWDCGPLPEMPDLEMVIRNFIDDNVHEALKTYVNDINLLIDSEKPDEVCVYLSEDYEVKRGKTGSFTKEVSLRETILDNVGESCFPDGAMHPGDAAQAMNVAEHLEAIAAELRRRVEVAKRVESQHEWR